MTSDTEHIRRQIEGTRRELSSDVNALTEKVTPSRIVGRRVDRARESLTNLKERIMGSSYSTTGTMSSAASGTADRVSTVASDAAGRVSDLASGAADTVRATPHAVRRQTEGNPLAAGLVAFGAGWLISSLLPTTRKEKELAVQAKDVAAERLQPVAQQVASEIKDNLREPAQQAVESVKSSASSATDNVTEESRRATQHVTGRASEAKDNVRDQSTSTTSR